MSAQGDQLGLDIKTGVDDAVTAHGTDRDEIFKGIGNAIWDYDLLRGSVSDADGDTYITCDPTDDDADEIHFYTFNVKRVEIKSNGATWFGAQAHTANNQGSVYIGYDGASAQNGAYYSKLLLYGGSGQTRHL